MSTERVALEKLRNEVLAILGLAREEIRAKVGNTNYGVLRLRLDEAKIALDAVVPASPATAEPATKQWCECGHTLYMHGTVSMAGKCVFAGCECTEWRAAAPVTGPDVAQQMPTQFLMSQSWAHSRGLGYRYSMSGQDLVDLLTDYTALIRTALEEQTRELESDLKTEREDCREWEKMYQEAERDLKKAESETRQLREALAPIVERLKNWQLEKQYERDALHQFALELESVLAGGKPS